MKIDRNLMREAIEKWGIECQMKILIGEIGELLSLFGKNAQGRDCKEQWQSECADVFITLSQLSEHIGYDEVQAEIEKKQNLLREKLNSDSAIIK